MRRHHALLLLSAALFALTPLACGCGGDDDDDDNDDEQPEADDDADPSDDDDDDTAPADDDNLPDDDPPYHDMDGYPEPFDPTQPGPYAVGVKTYVFVDESRDDFASRGKRTLLTEVWYPAPEWTRMLPRDSVRNFLGEWYDVIHGIGQFLLPPDELANFDAIRDVARDVPIYPGGNPFPLILVSHGNAAIRFASMSFAEYFASHGYIVVAPDHIGNAVFVTLPGRLQIYNPLLTPFEFTDRIDDFRFLVDKFTELGLDDPDGFFTKRIDLNRIGAMGHSFGAVTAAESVVVDDRIKAGIEMAGFVFPIWDSAYNDPMMFWYAGEDETMEDVEPLVRFVDFPFAPSPKFLINLFDAGHYTFSDACILIPSLLGNGDGCGEGDRRETDEPFDYIEHDKAMQILNTYNTAFFGYTLKGQEEMLDVLTENLFPEDLDLKYELDE
ncbi:MAG: hypothetical protein M5R36_14380 [Deltaproteobacteria bacterium]|nr:hypothetical protein [Deltaproteobacteria bacterium]